MRKVRVGKLGAVWVGWRPSGSFAALRMTAKTGLNVLPVIAWASWLGARKVAAERLGAVWVGRRSSGSFAALRMTAKTFLAEVSLAAGGALAAGRVAAGSSMRLVIRVPLRMVRLYRLELRSDGEDGMTYETLLCEVKDQIARVTLNRPKVLHALNAQVFDELERVFAALAGDAGVRVILLTGAGEKAFAAGADIGEMVALDAAEGEAKARRGQAVFRRIETCGRPVIACINGFALGGGCELAMACTMRLASETARLGQPEVKLGVIPGYGGTQRLPRLVGQARALKLLLTGEMVGAAEALRIGLVDEVVPAERLMERGEALARTMVGMAPLAVAGCLEAVRRGSELGLEAAIAVEAEIFGRLCGTEDKAEGTRAFLEKRGAVWRGR